MWEDLTPAEVAALKPAEERKVRQRAAYDYWDAFFNQGRVKKVKSKEGDADTSAARKGGKGKGGKGGRGHDWW